MAPLTIIDAKLCMMGAVAEKLPKKLVQPIARPRDCTNNGAPNAALGQLWQLMIHGYGGGDDGDVV